MGYRSLGIALADTLDDLIGSRRIEPQLAMRILANFDQSVAAVLGDKVKSRMSFKVGNLGQRCGSLILHVEFRETGEHTHNLMVRKYVRDS